VIALDERLPNGLRLVVDTDRVAPVAAVTVAYRAGSSVEGPGEGELAHLFEHMMFEGSARVAPGEHVALLTAYGGLVNGRTQPDCATYSSVVPNHLVELVLWLEAERLASLPAGLTPASLDRQRAVVRNEHRQRRAGVPYGSASSDLAERLFPPGHPYHTSMARRADLDGASLATVEAFFRLHYTAANAVVAVCGDVDAAAVREWTHACFGPLPPSVPPPPVTGPRPAGGARETVAAPVPRPRVYVAWAAPADGTPEHDDLVPAMAVLTGGQRARLRRLAAECDAVAGASLGIDSRSAGPSFVSGWVAPADGVPPAVAEEAFVAALRDLAARPPREEEVARAARLLETATLTRDAPLGGRAYTRATGALLHGDPARRPAVTACPAAVARAAGSVFGTDPVSLTYVPAGAP